MMLKLEKHWGWWRGIVPFIWLYNFKNYKSLEHNKRLYKKWGLKKSIFTSIESKDFKDFKLKEEDLPWLDRANALEALNTQHTEGKITDTEKKLLENWIEFGYIILPNHYSNEKINAINKEVETLKSSGALYENYTHTKIQDSIFKSEIINKIAQDESILKILNSIFEKEAFPFQSLNFYVGSQQRPHSDAFHMTTFPKGYMAGAWIALEDIGENQGPISYYPSSNRLIPNISREDIAEDNSSLLWNDTHLNKKYEDLLENLIASKGLKKEVYLPKKGDVLLWNYNLIHGGEKIIDKTQTRKSMVIHYFAKDVIAFHEISRRPAINKSLKTI